MFIAALKRMMMKKQQMFERRMKAYAEKAESLDDEVGMVMLPIFTNEEMRGGDDMFFVTHGPSMKALGEFTWPMYAAMEADEIPESSSLNVKIIQTAFQRIGPGSSDDVQ